MRVGVLAFSPDRRLLASGDRSGKIHYWDLSDGVPLAVVDRSGMLHWWDTQTGRRLSEFWPAHEATSRRLAIHPDGKRFATAGDDGKVRLWDALSVDCACEIGRRAFDSVRHRQYLGQNERSVACD